MRLGSLVMKVQDRQRGAAFWAGALHYRLRDGGSGDDACPVLVGDAAGDVTIVLDEDDATHLDLYVDSVSEREAEIERLISLGARRVEWSYPDAANHVVLADTEGNLFCVVVDEPVQDR